ncbi:MAG: hypothetical protein ABJ364_03495 [Lentilitoribacter sp.]
MTDTVRIINNNLLSQLHATGGVGAWDTLLEGVDRGFVFPQVQQEALRDGLRGFRRAENGPPERCGGLRKPDGN